MPSIHHNDLMLKKFSLRILMQIFVSSIILTLVLYNINPHPIKSIIDILFLFMTIFYLLIGSITNGIELLYFKILNLIDKSDIFLFSATLSTSIILICAFIYVFMNGIIEVTID